MTSENGLYDISASDRELLVELKNNPEGPHRPDVMRLLSRLLWTPIEGRIVLVCTRPHTEWRLGRLSGRRNEPMEVLEEPVFTDRRDAVWAAIAQRWQAVTGSLPSL